MSRVRHKGRPRPTAEPRALPLQSGHAPPRRDTRICQHNAAPQRPAPPHTLDRARMPPGRKAVEQAPPSLSLPLPAPLEAPPPDTARQARGRAHRSPSSSFSSFFSFFSFLSFFGVFAMVDVLTADEERSRTHGCSGVRGCVGRSTKCTLWLAQWDIVFLRSEDKITYRIPAASCFFF